MKKIFVFLFLLLCVSPANAAVDIKGINTMPYKPYDKEIKMEKIQSDLDRAAWKAPGHKKSGACTAQAPDSVCRNMWISR